MCLKDKRTASEDGMANNKWSLKHQKTLIRPRVKTNAALSMLSLDERKMDQLLHETDGSRRMANQIVHRVFRQQGCKQDKCIAGASVSVLFLVIGVYLIIRI